MVITQINQWTAWTAILLGAVMGIVFGLFFNRENWLGGYGSWPRRMLRLAHISLFGLGLINLAFVYFVEDWGIRLGLTTPAVLLASANGLMPLLCLLAAWRRRWVGLFFIPVGCVVFGIITTLLAKLAPMLGWWVSNIQNTAGAGLR